MSSLKKLASQTVIYGLTTILARLLNFALTPIHTGQIEKADYGTVNDLYSMIAFFMVILTFGMETAFFRFNRDDRYNQDQVFSHALLFTFLSSGFLIALSFAFEDQIAALLQYEDQSFLIHWMLAIVAMDAISAVPFARLRANNQPMRFLYIRLGTIALMVALNLFFFKVLPAISENAAPDSVFYQLYDPKLGVVYIFLANLIGNAFMIVLFLPDILKVRWKVDPKLLRNMLIYSAPLVLGGLAGITNEKAQYQFMKYLMPQPDNNVAMGIFGAMMKIATFMVLFIQAFRFAAEPFFFSGEGDFKSKMAMVMRYFVLIQSVIFLGLVCFTDLLQWTHFIDPSYWEGWHVVPILLFANLLLGINFNLNIWYKLENKTRMGAYIAFFGLAFTITANLILVPLFGYSGAAWATLISYFAMTVYSYYLNQKHFPTKYPLRAIGLYAGISLIMAILSYYILDHYWPYGLVIFSVYTGFIIWLEWPQLKNLKRS
jgi:O-antigen/teichoic acid export membrane protein